MIIWNASSSRTGKTLCTKVVHSLLTGRNIHYQNIGPNELTEELIDYTTTLQLNPLYIGSSDGAWWTELFRRNGVHLYFVRRDLRDSLISYMKLVKVDFNTALAAYYHAAMTYNQYDTLPANTCLKLSYEQDILNLPLLIVKLANFLGMIPTQAEIINITQQLYYPRVHKAISDQESTFFTIMEEYAKPPAGPAVLIEMWNNAVLRQYFIPTHQVTSDLINNGSVLTFEAQGATHTVILNLDSKTVRLVIPEGWQQGHISSPPNGGEWRQLLTPHQIAEMNALLGPFLDKWGYTV